MADKPQTELDKWLQVISQYENEFKKWDGRVTKILKRYRDDNRSQTNNETAKFNILWSNVETLIPAVFARLPKPDVSRRFGDNDPIGRVASLLIERCLEYEVTHYSDFGSMMQHSVQDRFLGGRGTSWVRYDPHIKTQDVQISASDIEAGEEGQQPSEEIDYECTPTDYVHWKDFGHSRARIWEDVQQVWRIVYLTKEALAERFGDKIAKKVPLDSGPDPLNKMADSNPVNNRAKIYELWDKDAGEVLWISKSAAGIIDRKPDPLGLEGFFPCPKPLYATTTSDSLVPVPDFSLYQDQAKELDTLSDRIDGLVQALRVRGVYDASQPALQRLLTEGDNNTLIGMDKWGAFTEKGGLKGSIDLVDISIIAQALLTAYEARDNIKAQIYEITGISDIIRGQGEASETATAQQIKGQYASLRLKSMQDAVAQYGSEALRLKAHVICTKYQDSTILKYAAADQLSQTDQQLLSQALGLIRNNPLRNFRIEVATDSLVLIDENQDKQDRMAFVQAFGDLLQRAVPAGQAVPELVPPIMEVMKYAVAGFKQARQIEGVIDQAMDQLKAKAAQMAQQGPQPTPEQHKANADIQAAQAKAQSDAAQAQAKAQADAAVAQAQAQTDQAEIAAKARLEQEKMAQEAQIRQAEMEAEAKIELIKARIAQQTAIAVARVGAKATNGNEEEGIAYEGEEELEDPFRDKELHEKLDALIAHLSSQPDMAGAINNLAAAHKQTAQGLADLHGAVTSEKEIVRDPRSGRAVGTRIKQQQSLPN